MTDLTAALQQTVVEAIKSRSSLNIQGSGSKAFLSDITEGIPLSTQDHTGIICYQPTELVLTARSGTTLAEIETLLAENGQLLPFEPPHFGQHATLGGMIATGLSGSIRPFSGSVRDFVLGCKIINGRGEILQFGGQVMKNVAGYDVSRLMVGAMGTLGVLLEVSIKVLPAPNQSCYLSQSREAQDAVRLMQVLSAQNLPLTGLAYDGESVHIRLAGAEASVKAARNRLGGEQQQPDQFWQRLREQSHHFFTGNTPLWRLSVPGNAPIDPGQTRQIIDWAGALRWIKTTDPASHMFKYASKLNGHAQLFRTDSPAVNRRQPLSPAMMMIHKKVKASLDPQGIFNLGQLYPEL